MNELERWANFYLLMSAAAATLIGLLFVVISLGADRIVEDRTADIRMYLTPTVIYFASALFLAALLAFPNHTRYSASLCICLVGVAGLVYSGSFLIGRGGKKNCYGLQDRIVYAVLPFAAYGLHVFGGVWFFQAPPTRTHLGGCRDAVVACACHSQLVGYRRRCRLSPSWPATFKVAHYLRETSPCLDESN